MKTLDTLFEDLQNNETLKQEVQSVLDQPEALAALLARHGYPITEEDLKESAGAAPLNDEALKGVSGGASDLPPLFRVTNMLKERYLKSQAG